MNKEKQIEEMAKLVAVQIGYGCNEQDHCDMSCQVCKVGCIPHEDAQILYEAGYRKQREVAEEVFDWLEEKGFLNIEVWAIQDVKDELKKKYTESEKENGN